jgi:K+-transporting ATPase KdpF subunit
MQPLRKGMWEDLIMGEILVLVVALALIIYLFVSVIRPERF